MEQIITDTPPVKRKPGRPRVKPLRIKGPVGRPMFIEAADAEERKKIYNRRYQDKVKFALAQLRMH